MPAISERISMLILLSDCPIKASRVLKKESCRSSPAQKSDLPLSLGMSFTRRLYFYKGAFEFRLIF